jgi:hypothetical protein
VASITEFLEARIAEDEAVARVCDSATWRIISEDDTRHPLWVEGLSIAAADSTWDACIAVADAQHATRHDPRRVLSECAAKRATLESYLHLRDSNPTSDPVKLGRLSAFGDVVHDLAEIYKDHPDYQQEWAL